MTGQETGGFCMPCFKKQKIKEQEEYIQKNRKVVNLYAGLVNPVDVIKVFHKPRPHNSLLNYEPYPNLISKSYQALDNEQKSELVEYATNLYKEQEIDQAKQIASCLAAFTNADITVFLEKMISDKDYYPPFLFKKSNLNIKKQLLEDFLKNEDPEGDLFKSIACLTEMGPHLEDKIHDDMKYALSKYKKTALTVKKEIQATRKDGLKKTILGNINVLVSGESWPICDNIALNPVIQLAISDLPYIPQELEGIEYLCVYIHPDDPAALLEKDNALVIRTYKNEDLTFIEAPESINQEIQPMLLEFEKVNDYESSFKKVEILD